MTNSDKKEVSLTELKEILNAHEVEYFVKKHSNGVAKIHFLVREEECLNS